MDRQRGATRGDWARSFATATKPTWLAVAIAGVLLTTTGLAAGNSSVPVASPKGWNGPLPTWWAKMQAMSHPPALALQPSVPTPNSTIGRNLDLSRELGPQSETSVAINPANPKQVVAGSNEIFRNPMRAYFSSDAGKTWGAVDLPLPPPIAQASVDFGSDPGVAWDLRGSVYYSYIVVFFTKGFAKVVGSEMAVAHSTDGGQSWNATYFALQTGANPFDDKPMIAVDTHSTSPFANRVYVAWDLTGTDNGDDNGVLVSHSTDHGRTFSAPTYASPVTGSAPRAVIGTSPFVAPDGVFYVAWHANNANQIQIASSPNGGRSFGAVHVVADTRIAFDVAIPAQNLRHALIYPSCGASPFDTDLASHPSYLYCSWVDGSRLTGVSVYLARSPDGGQTWSAPLRVNDDSRTAVNDHFNQWLAVDPVTGRIHLSWYDTRLDPSRLTTNVYYAQSANNGSSFTPNQKVTTAPTNETSPRADQGNQYGDYEGIAAYNGVVYPVWTDRRSSVAYFGEEVFTASIDAD